MQVLLELVLFIRRLFRVFFVLFLFLCVLAMVGWWLRCGGYDGRWVLKGLFFPTSPLLLGYETWDKYKMVSKSQSRP